MELIMNISKQLTYANIILDYNIWLKVKHPPQKDNPKDYFRKLFKLA